MLLGIRWKRKKVFPFLLCSACTVYVVIGLVNLLIEVFFVAVVVLIISGTFLDWLMITLITEDT